MVCEVLNPPFKSKFIDYVNCNIPVKDVTKVNTVIGIGTTIYNFVDANGKYLFLPCIFYHLPTTDVQLYIHKLIIVSMVSTPPLKDSCSNGTEEP